MDNVQSASSTPWGWNIAAHETAIALRVETLDSPPSKYLDGGRMKEDEETKVSISLDEHGFEPGQIRGGKQGRRKGRATLARAGEEDSSRRISHCKYDEGGGSGDGGR